MGLDNVVIDIGDNKVLIVTTDIIWIMREFGEYLDTFHRLWNDAKTEVVF